MTDIRLILDEPGKEILSYKKQIPLAYQNDVLLTIEVGDPLMRGGVTVPLRYLRDMIRQIEETPRTNKRRK